MKFTLMCLIPLLLDFCGLGAKTLILFSLLRCNHHPYFSLWSILNLRNKSPTTKGHLIGTLVFTSVRHKFRSIT